MTAALDLLAALVLEDGSRWGDVADPHQWEDAEAVLDRQANTPRRHWLGRSRGWSKTTDVGGIAAAYLIDQARPGAEGYAAAADAGQAGILIGKIRGLVQRSGLTALLDVQTRRVVVKAGPSAGAFIEVIPADEASAWGLTPAFLVLDEACQWPSSPNAKGVYEALTTALPKVPDSRLVIMTSAGSPAHWSRQVYEAAQGEPGLWRVSDVHGPPPWMDPAEVEAERRRLPESSFLRLFMNVWADAEDRLTTLDDLKACITLDGPQEPRSGRRYTVGVDIGLKNDRTVVTVAHAERRPGSDGPSVTVVLDRQDVWAGSRARPVNLDLVEAHCIELDRRFGRPVFVVDPWQAAQLAQRLRARGLRAEEFAFNAQSVGRLAERLHLLLRDRALALPPDDELIDELANVRLRETSPGVFRMDHDAGRHDDRAISLALAANRLVETTPVRGRGRLQTPGAGALAGLDAVVSAAGVMNGQGVVPAQPLRRRRRRLHVAGASFGPAPSMFESLDEQAGYRAQGLRDDPAGISRPYNPANEGRSGSPFDGSGAA